MKFHFKAIGVSPRGDIHTLTTEVPLETYEEVLRDVLSDSLLIYGWGIEESISSADRIGGRCVSVQPLNYYRPGIMENMLSEAVFWDFGIHIKWRHILFGKQSIEEVSRFLQSLPGDEIKIFKMWRRNSRNISI